ncbi:MAG: hydrogenase nickel incorporation protein HypB [Acidobacteria bacterium]|nr:hydrogenase nickel incorporation protein HypB [Acidobacteriota bacterium]
MCGTCGCSDGVKATVTNLETGEHSHVHEGHVHEGHPHEGHSHEGHRHEGHAHGHDHSHDHPHSHDHGHSHDHSHDHGEVVRLETAVLAKNDALAARNRAWLAGREVLALNLVSSPGAGKTSLLERTIRELGQRRAISVIEGDQQTLFDAQRIQATGARAVQVNTGTGCHLEADMVMRALRELRPAPGSVVMIENVGNLVCPALFDLGEACKVAILSVTEGEDKPAKYPHMFQASKLMLLNKIDLLPHVDFDVERALAYARQVNPDIEVLQVSAKTGEGLDAWYQWIEAAVAKVPESAFA